MESLLTAVQEEQCDRATALKCAAGPLSRGRPAARTALVREIKINRIFKHVRNRTVQELRNKKLVQCPASANIMLMYPVQTC